MVIRIQDVVLNDLTFEVTRRGCPLQVPPKVFDAIVFLARNRERVVSVLELRETIWRGAVVTDDAVNQVIRRARRVLGGESDAQTIISIRGRGYRFVGGDVVEQGEGRSRSSSASFVRGAMDAHAPCPK